MADMLEKMRSSLNRGVAAVSVRASSSLEKAKLKTHMESLEADINRTLAAAGAAAYDVWAAGSADYSAVEAMFTSVRDKREEIDRLSAELGSIDQRDREILGSAKPEAGQPKPETVCPQCGARYDEPVRFCRKCGAKLTQD